MAFSGDSGPTAAAVKSWLIARYEMPNMPTRPFEFTSLDAHATRSTPSWVCSMPNISNDPPEAPVPRTSTITSM